MRILSIPLVLAIFACSGDDPTPPTTVVPDLGVADFDAAFLPDLGFFDGGSGDAGPEADAGSACTMNGISMIEGVPVELGDPRGPPENPSGNPSITTCLGQPLIDTTNFQNNYCPVECIETFGVALTEGVVGALDVAVFPEQIGGSDVDPTFDVARGVDRQADARLPVGFRIVESDPAACESGYQLELGFLDLGAQSLLAKERYIVRVRSTSVAVDWPTTYHWGFVRRNDAVPVVSPCASNALRTPDPQIAFPIFPPNIILDGVSLATDVVGTDSFADGLGMGHAVIETRDCDRNGILMARATAGFFPEPAGAFYLGLNDQLAPASRETTAQGVYLGVGFPGNTATSSATGSTTAGVAVSVNGMCTEAFGGATIPIFPDGVTYFRSGREVTLP